MGGLPDASTTGFVDAARDGGEGWTDRHASAQAGDAAGAGPLAGLQVLVVEDHDDSRELLADFLGAQGATVLGAANAHEAMAQLERLRDDVPAALLCDIALPGENGYALLARMRRYEQARGRPARARLVAFAVSAFTRAEDRERSLAAGFRDHLGKPLSQSDLVERLVRLREDAGGRPIDGPR
jgi:CheY-like chemotaxis protein